MKLKTALKKRCSDCYFITRGKYNYIYCKNNKKHKQKQK